MKIDSFWLIVGCFVFWIISVILSGVIPIVIYFLTGRARTSSLKTRYIIIMEGRKALQFVVFQFSLYSGFIIAFLGFLFESNYGWIGAVMAIISIPFMITATVGARQDTRKNSFYDIKELWRN